MSTLITSVDIDLHSAEPLRTIPSPVADPRCSPAPRPLSPPVVWARWLSRRPAPPPAWRRPESVVLVVAEDHGDRTHVERALQLDELRCEFRVVESLAQARDFLSGRGLYADPAVTGRPTLLLMDLEGAASRAAQACRELEQDGLLPGATDVVGMIQTEPAFLGDFRGLCKEARMWRVGKPEGIDEYVAVLRDLVRFSRSRRSEAEYE